MRVIILSGRSDIVIQVKRSARSKRLNLRVSSLDGRITLTAPPKVPERQLQAFIAEREVWLRQNLDKLPAPSAIALGKSLPILGVAHQIASGASHRVTHGDGVVHVPFDKPKPAVRLQSYLKALARVHLVGEADKFAARLGIEYARLSLRDTRSRWGSCTQDKALMYSWRLVLAPIEVLSYVAAHEVAHLKFMDHSAQFWNQVGDLYGEYDAPRAWLKAQGASLHRFQFVD